MITPALVLAHLESSIDEPPASDNGLSVAVLLLMILVFIGLVTFWVLMFLNVLRNKKLGDTVQLLWGIAMLFFPPMALLYYFVAYNKKAKS